MKCRNWFLVVGVLVLLLSPLSAARASAFGETPAQGPQAGRSYFLPLIARFAACAAPQLIAPTNNAQLRTIRPTFQYATDPAATRWTLDISQDPIGWSNPETYWLGGGGWITVFHNLGPGTDYYWRITKECGSTQIVSPTWHFRTGSGGEILPAPTLLSPDDGVTSVGSEVELTWAAVRGAVGYWVHVYWVGHYTHLYAETEPRMVVTGLSPSSEYEWFVEAYNDYAYGTASAIRSFSTGAFAARPISEPGNTITSTGLQLAR